MNITAGEMDKLAKLAKLEFTDQEKSKLIDQVQQIIRYVENLNELDVENVAPTAHLLNLKNVFREDEVQASLPQEEALKNAPVEKDGFFVVPRVIQK